MPPKTPCTPRHMLYNTSTSSLGCVGVCVCGGGVGVCLCVWGVCVCVSPTKPPLPSPSNFLLTSASAFATCSSLLISSWIISNLSEQLSFISFAPGPSANKHPAKTRIPCLSRCLARALPNPLSQPKGNKEKVVSITYITALSTWPYFKSIMLKVLLWFVTACYGMFGFFMVKIMEIFKKLIHDYSLKNKK